MKTAIAIPLALILLVLVLSPAQSVRNAAYGAYNQDPEGAAQLFTTQRLDGYLPTLALQGHTVLIDHNGLHFLKPQRHALLSIAPQTKYTQREVATIHQFLNQGGRMILADDYGTGRDLLEQLSPNATLTATPTYTPYHDTNPDFPYALDTGTIAGLPPRTVMNLPTIVDGTAPPVLTSHDLSWRDENANQVPDLNEPIGPVAYARLDQIGNGQLLIIGDASIFSNDMATIDHDTRTALIAWLTTGNRTVILDEAHRAGFDPLGIVPILAGNPPTAVTIAFWSLLATAGFLYVFTPTIIQVQRNYLRRPPKDPLLRAIWDELPP